MRYCIEHDIMADILRQNREGVMKMLLTEFDMKQYMKSEREIWLEEGKVAGEERLSVLIQALIRDNRQKDVERATTDTAYRKTLYEEYGIMD